MVKCWEATGPWISVGGEVEAVTGPVRKRRGALGAICWLCKRRAEKCGGSDRFYPRVDGLDVVPTFPPPRDTKVGIKERVPLRVKPQIGRCLLRLRPPPCDLPLFAACQQLAHSAVGYGARHPSRATQQKHPVGGPKAWSCACSANICRSLQHARRLWARLPNGW